MASLSHITEQQTIITVTKHTPAFPARTCLPFLLVTMKQKQFVQYSYMRTCTQMNQCFYLEVTNVKVKSKVSYEVLWDRLLK